MSHLLISLLLINVVISYHELEGFHAGQNYDYFYEDYDEFRRPSEDYFFTESLHPTEDYDSPLNEDYFPPNEHNPFLYDSDNFHDNSYNDDSYNYDNFDSSWELDFKNDYDEHGLEEEMGFHNMPVEDLWIIINSIDVDDDNEDTMTADDKSEENNLPILQRRKRGLSRSRVGSRSRESSSRGGGGSYDRRRPSTSTSSGSSTTSSKPKDKYGWNVHEKTSSTSTETKPKPSAPPDETINTGSTGGKPYPTGHYPPAGTNTVGSNPPSSLLPGIYPSGSYPSGGHPSHGTSSSAGYPLPGTYQSGGYSPHGTYPSSSTPLKPSPGYPQPSAGYPHPGTYLSGGYPPHGTYPSSSIPLKPSPGYPQPSGTKYPHTGGGPGLPETFSKPKVSKKEKVKQKIKQAIEAYAVYKMNKKMKHNTYQHKFISPSHMGMGMGTGMHGFHSGGTLPEFGGHKNKNIAKKVLGGVIKLAIAKYAMKFGMKAAKAYFEYKLGRSLEEHIIEKFVSRYHNQQTRSYFRHKKRFAFDLKQFEKENITLGEECARECKEGEKWTCFFSFRIHLYQTLSRACYNCPNNMSDCERPECVVGSGRRKLITVVNRQLPGPTIQVCQEDKVLLEVQNELPNAGVTLHVRGQTYRRNQQMEGTPGLTQSPISPGNIFAYSFRADNPGTHFWHANTGVLRSEGVFGSFIVKERTLTHGALYDVDLINQTLMISEDFVRGSEEQLVFLTQKQGRIEVYSLLINGKGMKLDENAGDVLRSDVTYARIKVLAGKRHRLRIISGVSSNCPFTFRIPSQQLVVIYADGSPVSPKETKTLLVFPGERYDVVLSGLGVGLYWIEVYGSLDCANQTQYAILESAESVSFPSENLDVKGSSDFVKDLKLPSDNPTLVDSNFKKISKSAFYCNSSEITCLRNLTGTSSLPHKVSAANLTLYLSLTDRKIHNEHVYSLFYYNIESMPYEERSSTWQINNLTLKLPPVPLLVKDKPLKKAVCSSAGVLRQHCVESFCECLHLMELPLGSLVDIVLVNEGVANSLQPQTMYLHGYNFWMISQSKEFIYSNETYDNSTSDYMDLLRVIVRNAEELLIKNLEKPVLINSITVPERGYSVIRFKADNPGFWLLESSSIFKSATGMGVVLKVGEKTDLPEISKKLSSC